MLLLSCFKDFGGAQKSGFYVRPTWSNFRCSMLTGEWEGNSLLKGTLNPPIKSRYLTSISFKKKHQKHMSKIPGFFLQSRETLVIGRDTEYPAAFKIKKMFVNYAFLSNLGVVFSVLVS